MWAKSFLKAKYNLINYFPKLDLFNLSFSNDSFCKHCVQNMENCQSEIDNVRKQLENVVAEMNLKKLIVDKTKEEVSVLCRLVTEFESEKKVVPQSLQRNFHQKYLKLRLFQTDFRKLQEIQSKVMHQYSDLLVKLCELKGWRTDVMEFSDSSDSDSSD